jgi:hypothetical protein
MSVTIKKNSAAYGGSSYYKMSDGKWPGQGGHVCAHADIWQYLRSGEVTFQGVQDHHIMLDVLQTIETKRVCTKVDWVIGGDARLLSRILRAGGFVGYIEKLEEFIK